MRSKRVRTSVVVGNVISPVNRRSNSTEAFLFYRAQKIARIFAAVQPRFRDWRRVKAALESKTRFLRRVIERAHDEVFTVVSLRTSREFIVFVRQALHNFRPWDLGVSMRDDRHHQCDQECPDRSVILSDTEWSRRIPRRYSEHRNGIPRLRSE